MNNNKKIAFIMCVNNEDYYNEACAYINQLNIPDGYEIDVLAVTEAPSMCSGYNEAMNSSDAKYKIYMHQDVMIINPGFINDIIDIFNSDTHIGMIGMIGATSLPKNGTIFSSWNVGMVDVREPDMAYIYVAGRCNSDVVNVMAADGLLLATQYDLIWREDLFTVYDFYDASQCLEFKKNGYRIVVPNQGDIPWVIHDCSFAKLRVYNREREIFLKEYSDYLAYDSSLTCGNVPEWDALSIELGKMVKDFIISGGWNEIESIMKMYREKDYRSSELETLYNMNEIHKNEVAVFGFSPFFQNLNLSEIYRKYTDIRFALRRMEFGWNDDTVTELKEMISNGSLTFEALMVFIIHSTLYTCKMLEMLKKIYINSGQHQNAIRINTLINSTANKPIKTAYGRRCDQ